MSRSLNKAQLIGNLTRDPELRYTPQGTAVCSFSVATNRQWRTESGDMRDEAEFHRIVAWDKLAEICANMLGKGKKVFVEGRLQTRKWTSQDGQPRTTVEIVISDMLLLDRGGTRTSSSSQDYSQEESIDLPEDFEEAKEKVEEKKSKPKKKTTKKSIDESDTEDEIPF
jgi:single-strand DNA-binding protein